MQKLKYVANEVIKRLFLNSAPYKLASRSLEMITDDIEAFAWILDNKLTKLYSVLTLSLRIVSSQSMNTSFVSIYE